ncbi:MAG: competence protein ComJ [Moraxellaceae bacterium]|nr:competence protein ComJ [Moraxellaceae bacterium]
MQSKIDLTVSGFIGLAARPVEDEELVWGNGNIAQGLVQLDALVMLDPLADEDFGADVTFRLTEKFLPNRAAQRCIEFPLQVGADEPLVIFSAEDEEPVPLDLEPGDYTVIYEVCLSREVFYVLTFIKGALPHASARKDDGWGLKKGVPLTAGVF